MSKNNRLNKQVKFIPSFLNTDSARFFTKPKKKYIGAKNKQERRQ